MHYRPKTIIFTVLIFSMLFLTATAVANDPTADIQKGGAIEFSPKSDVTESNLAEPTVSSSSGGSFLYLPIVFKPTFKQLEFITSDDCSTIDEGPFTPPAIFTSSAKQLAVRITLDGYQGQAYTYTWFQNGDFILNGVNTVPPAGFDIEAIVLGSGCSNNLPSGEYRLRVTQGGNIVLDGTATLP